MYLLRLILIESKKYAHEYRRIFLTACISALILAALSFLVYETAERGSLFEHFTVGIVEYDGYQELDLIMNILNENEDIKTLLSIERMEIGEAEARFAAGDIPAYVVLPPGFVRSIMNGSNIPFEFHGNPDMPLSVMIVRAFSEAGISFLTSSQAGIYSVYDFASDRGMSGADINDKLFFPINYEYAAQLLRYDTFFKQEPLTEPGFKSAKTFYMQSFAIFFLLINMTAFAKSLLDHTPDTRNRFRIAGVPALKVHGVRYAALLIPTMLLCLPAFFLFGWRLFVIAPVLAGFYFICSRFFKSEIKFSVFVTVSSVAMMFFSGGIVPTNFMPDSFENFKYLTLNYWLVSVL